MMMLLLCNTVHYALNSRQDECITGATLCTARSQRAMYHIRYTMH